MNNSLAEVHPELITEWSEKNHTVLHQVLQIAVDDDFIRNNPSDNVLRELKKAHCFQSEKRRALTKLEQELFLNFMKTHPVYEHWYPVFSVMIFDDYLERFHEPATEKGKEEPVAYGSLAKEQFNAEIERHGRY